MYQYPRYTITRSPLCTTHKCSDLPIVTPQQTTIDMKFLFIIHVNLSYSHTIIVVCIILSPPLLIKHHNDDKATFCCLCFRYFKLSSMMILSNQIKFNPIHYGSCSPISHVQLCIAKHNFWWHELRGLSIAPSFTSFTLIFSFYFFALLILANC